MAVCWPPASPAELLQRTGASTLENAFIALLPEQQRQGYQPVTIPPLVLDKEAGFAIEAHHLTMKFGDFTAVDNVSFQIRRGEIFGFLGSNGCGKSTTMKMLTGLLPASAGSAELFGHPLDPQDIATRKRVGYMSQAFSLYGELTVRQNLELHARLFHVPAADIPARVQEMSDRFGLQEVLEELPERLPLGIRQRLSLAVAMVHKPELLILDEPTSGVDPVARDNFWRLMIDLARHDGVTIFISTHFMNEAERCDRISLMHAGKVLLTDTPAAIVAQRDCDTLEQAFIDVLIDAGAGERINSGAAVVVGEALVAAPCRSSSFAFVQPGPAVQLRLAGNAGAAARSVAVGVVAGGDTGADAVRRLRHHPGCGRPEFCRSRSGPDGNEPGLCAELIRLAVF